MTAPCQAQTLQFGWDPVYDILGGGGGLLDVDSDGDPDRVGAGATGIAFIVWENAGNGIFSGPYRITDPAVFLAWALVGGDIDGDGDIDICLVHYSPAPLVSSLFVYINAGPLSYRNESSLRLPTLMMGQAQGLRLLDCDGDGDLDLLVLCMGPDRLLINDGTGRFTDETAARLPALNYTTNACAVVDWEGDGDLDLVTANGDRSLGSQDNWLLLNNGSGRFLQNFLIPSAGISLDVHAVDLDGDGAMEALFVNLGTSAEFWTWTGSGFSSVVSVLPPAAQGGFRDIAIGDIDGDSDVDFALTGGLPPMVLVENLGGMQFRDATSALGGAGVGFSVDLADLDLDGDIDIVTRALWGPSRSVTLVNLRRHLLVPTPPTIGGVMQVGLFSGVNAVVLPGFALGQQSTSFGGLGILGLDPSSLVIGSLVRASPSSPGIVQVPVPPDPRWIGTEVFAQGLFLDLVPPGGLRLGNWLGASVR